MDINVTMDGHDLQQAIADALSGSNVLDEALDTDVISEQITESRGFTEAVETAVRNYFEYSDYSPPTSFDEDQAHAWAVAQLNSMPLGHDTRCTIGRAFESAVCAVLSDALTGDLDGHYGWLADARAALRGPTSVQDALVQYDEAVTRMQAEEVAHPGYADSFTPDQDEVVEVGIALKVRGTRSTIGTVTRVVRALPGIEVLADEEHSDPSVLFGDEHTTTLADGTIVTTHIA